MTVLDLHVDDIPEGRAHRVLAGDRAVAVVRIRSTVYAIDDQCSHMGLRLSDGMLYTDSAELECRHHGSCFSLIDGTPDAPPARDAVACHAASIVGDRIHIIVQEDDR